ncbi:MAG: winged helix-turn-helix domain-containing protein [Candidatus Omnitrophica bacterium]|nr:winged helix-turn-helix domain-containing protein [Candidatus Omnitrophota bacterium]
MSDCYHEIGETAGKIYRVLEKGGSQNVGALRKSAEVRDGDLFNQALGWLAREAKIQFKKNGKQLEVSLESFSCCQTQ